MLVCAGELAAGCGEEGALNVDVMLYVDNISKFTTENALRGLFMQVGEVTSLNIVRDILSGRPKGYGYLTMSAQSEADAAVSRFNAQAFDGYKLKVSLVKRRTVSGLA